MDKILRFKIGEESFPTILENRDKENSPFSSIITSAIGHLENLYKGSSRTSGHDSGWQYKTPNNILAFLGDRGTGKTSCMRSVVKDCRERHNDDWLIMDEIDPSFFDENHNILNIFIATLYGLFKEDVKNWNSLTRLQQDELRAIQDKFRAVKSALRYYDNEIKLEDEFETDELNHLNEGVRLKSILNELIGEYLKYKERRFLVVSIDDLDLNVKCAYQMMEFIRKFLILPQVAILIAAKYNQLFDNICLVLTKHYKDIMYRVSHKEIAEMAERYLNKMLPLDQRFEMPSANAYLDALLIIEDKVKSDRQVGTANVASKVLSLIFAKTRYLFYNSSGMPSLVIPRNLRDLRMLVSMLWKMDDFGERSGSENQEIFKNYFFQEWMGIIEPEYRPFVRHMLDEEDMAKINRFVISNLYNLFLKDIESFATISSELKERKSSGRDSSYVRDKELLHDILNPSNSYWNVSIGDVVVIMNTVKKIHDSGKIRSLLFFIETFYSIRLYETYNQMTGMTYESGFKMPSEKPTTDPELKASVRADIPAFYRLNGGSFFSVSGDSFIPVSQNGKDRREQRMINGRFLLEEINKVVSEYIKLGFTSERFDINQIPSHLSARLRLCEFFMLTVRERVITRTSDNNRRLANEPLYFKPYGNTAKNLLFDVTTPFINAIYPKLAYDRFNPLIFDVAYEDPGSLVNRMTFHGETRGKDNATWELMSKAAVRNMEILEDLTEWLYSKKNSIRSSGQGLIGSLYDFYNQFEIVRANGEMPVKGYCVKTYGRKSDESSTDQRKPYYIIDYSIYYLLGEVLQELNEQNCSEADKEAVQGLKSLFDGIMSENDIFINMPSYSLTEVKKALYPYCGHSVVDLTFGNKDKDLTSYELADGLSWITLRYRYDFSDRLPRELQLYYNGMLITNYDSSMSGHNTKKEELNDEISEKKERLDGIKDDIKMLKQDISQRKKDIVKLKQSINKLHGQISAGQKTLDFLRSQSNEEGLTKTEKGRRAKSLEDTYKSLQNNESMLNETVANLSLSESDLDGLSVELLKRQEEIKRLNEEIKKTGKIVEDIDKEINQLKFNHDNKIPIE